MASIRIRARPSSLCLGIRNTVAGIDLGRSEGPLPGDLNMTVSRSVVPRGRTPRSMLAPFACAALMLLQGSAAALQPGTYRCWSYNVGGVGGDICRLAPPIVLRQDGRYEESATQGTYQLSGDRVHFSHSTIRGPGQILAENLFAFEYEYRQWRHTVTYLCQDCNLPDVKHEVTRCSVA